MNRSRLFSSFLSQKSDEKKRLAAKIYGKEGLLRPDLQLRSLCDGKTRVYNTGK